MEHWRRLWWVFSTTVSLVPNIKQKMTVKNKYTDLLTLNLSILFISTSGVLGKYIELPVPIIIFLRAFIAAILLFLYAKIKGLNFGMARKSQIHLMLGGIFLGVHWITYFYALKFSNVAIGMLSLYTFPIITSILEPLFLRKKFLMIHFILGLIVLLGIYLLAPKFSVKNHHFLGLCFGVLSALFYSVRNIMLKSKENIHDQSIIMIYQLVVISVLLIPTLIFFDSSNLIEYLPSSILLAILTTAVGHTLFVHSLKYFSTTSASLMSSLQPIYGIILAYIFLSESPGLRTIIGGILIISTVIIESIRIKKET